MPQEKTITVYKYQELTGRAKERATATLQEWACDFEWWDCTQEDFHAFLTQLAGFDNVTSQFSGFSSQGDGASFDFKGLDVAKLFSGDVSGYAPYSGIVMQWRDENAALIRKALRVKDSLYAVSAKNGYGTHYSHSRTRYASLELDYPTEICANEPKRVYAVVNDLEKAITDIMRRLADAYYSSLESEYNSRHEESYLTDMADANEYLWDALGRPAHNI
jgi:hypothetical protein